MHVNYIDCTHGSNLHTAWLASGTDKTMHAWEQSNYAKTPARGIKTRWVLAIHERSNVNITTLKGALEWHVENTNGHMYVYTRPSVKSRWFLSSVV